MQNWKYISVIVLVLLGGVSYFGYWALSQNELALDAYDRSYSSLSANLAAHTTKVALNRTTTTITDISNVATAAPDISLTFPVTEDTLYIGCSYKIAWETSTTTAIQSLDIALVDFETKEVAGPIASGLSATSTTQGFEHLDWKVGRVWPGEFYILVSKINGQEISKKSGVFTIQQIPEGKSLESFCSV